jgi:predicted deacylase
MSLAVRRRSQALTMRNCSVEDSEVVDMVGDEDSEVVDTGVDVGDMVDVGDLVGVVEDMVMKKLRNMRRWMLSMVGRR